MASALTPRGTDAGGTDRDGSGMMRVVFRGRVVADRFELEQLAEAGGMGAVYRGRDRLTGARVAVKLLAGGNERWAERFRREAVVLAGLSHPAIVGYVAHGVTETGEPWLAMEWLDGEPLSRRLRRARLGIGDTRDLGIRIADALAVAHHAGVIHRDIKPANVFLVDGDVRAAKVLDFGVARSRAVDSDTTRTGDRVGTPRYMAPEQVRAAHTVDWRCDLWSLGCVLYSALAGRPPFQATDEMAIWGKILLEEPPPLTELRPDAPMALVALVARLLAKAAEDRPASAAAVADELRRLEVLVGNELTGITAIGSTLAPSTERRRLAVVMVGGPAGDRPATGADTLVDPPPLLRAALDGCAREHGGHLEALASGHALITFVGSAAATDLIARAARCALAVRALTPAPIALASGHGIPGGAIGDALDRAAAVLRAAGEVAGTSVAIDTVAAGLLGPRFVVDGGGAPAWLVEERAGDDPVRSVLGKRTPTVGRDRELLVLTQAIDDSAEEPAARVVLVTADAGVGKTRLRHELLERLADRTDEGNQIRHCWLGRGDPTRAGAPFVVAASALRWRCGVVAAPATPDERAAAGAALRDTIHQLELAEPARVEAFLAELIGAPLRGGNDVQLDAARQSPRLMSDQIRRAWIDLVAADAARGPVLIVVDDLHWGDAPSVELLDDALRALAHQPLAVVGFARPEVGELFPRLWAQRGPTVIRLGPLPRRAAGALAREVLGPRVEAAVIDRIVERAAGHALYLEELLRAAAAGDVEHAPETVIAMVQVRLEALSSAARQVLRAGSVLGSAFRGAAVTAILREVASERDVASLLDELTTRELLARTAAPDDDSEYRFRHELIRDGAYAMLGDDDRRIAHRAAGLWLEDQREREAQTVAQHFERGGEPARAALWYRFAAEQALDAGDPASVLTLALRGLDCGAADAERAALLMLSAEAHDWRGDTAMTEVCALEAMAASPEGSSTWLRAAGEVAIAAGRASKVLVLVRVSDRLLRVARADDRNAFVIALGHAAAELLLLGRRDDAARVLARLDDAARPGLSPLADGWRLRVRAIEAVSDGDAVACLALSEQSVACFEACGERREVAGGRSNVGFGQISVGRIADAEATLRRALAVTVEMATVRTTTIVTQNLALAVLFAGRPDEALALAEDAERMAREQDAPRIAGAAVLYQARALLASGAAAEARRRAERAVIALADVPPTRAYGLAVVAEAALALAAPDVEVARSAVALADQLGGIDEGDAYVRWVLARSLIATGADAGPVIADALARLSAVAARIPDDAGRAAFWDGVPEHRALRAMA